jgi:spore maturation protein CgeB
MKHIADPSSLLLDGLAAEGYRIAGTWKEMSVFFGVGNSLILFFSFRSTKIPADYYWFLMRHDYQTDYIFNS